MPAPDRFYRAVQELIDRYRELEADADGVLQGLDLTDPRNRGKLRALAKDIDARNARLTSEAKMWLNRHLPAVWMDGALATRVGAFQWAGAHQDAVALLVKDTAAELLANTTHMSRDVKQLVRVIGRERTLAKVATGTPAKTAGRELAARLHDVGITSVTYSNGRNVQASTYGEMVIRTKTAVSYSMGGLNQMVGNGIRYVECVDGAECGLYSHDSGNNPNGRILPVDVAAAYPISHPACRRDFIPRSDVTSDDEALVATSWRSPEQLTDQANFEKYLLAQQKAKANTRARQARASARTARTPRSSR